MSEAKEPEKEPEKAPTTPEKKENVFDSVNASVKRKVHESSGDLRSRVEAALVKNEIEKRTELLLAGLKKIGEMRNDTKKISKPTSVVEKLIDGKFVKEEQYTSDAVKKIKDHTEKLKTLEAALEKAMNTFNFEDLKKSVGNDKSGDTKEEAAE